MHFLRRLKAQVSSVHEDLLAAFIRPPRDIYLPSQLGPVDFYLDGHRFHRNDFELHNQEGYRLRCSHFVSCEPDGTPDQAPRPCVVYLHGNCSSRLEAIHSGAREHLLPRGISLCCLDFAGSGLSEGDYVTLGYKEARDLQVLVSHLRSLPSVSEIALWGRSMGAVTALRYAAKDPLISALVIDSPFASIRRLADELKKVYAGMWASTGLVMWWLRGEIRSRTGLDLDLLNPIECAPQLTLPALFVAAQEDHFINPKHAKDIHDAFAGEKEFYLVAGDHNSVRAHYVQELISDFFVAVFRPCIPGGGSTVYGRVGILQGQREKQRREQLEKKSRKRAASLPTSLTGLAGLAGLAGLTADSDLLFSQGEYSTSSSSAEGGHSLR